MSIQFYDTYRRRKVPFEPVNPGQVMMYNCGPTVYDHAHIGNFRANVFADILGRWLKVRGYEVRQVMNITDVDDKTIRGSREAGISLSKLTGKYKEDFFSDLSRMNIRPAYKYPAATEHVDIMVRMIEKLIETGHAYTADDGSVYFSVASFPDYGRLSGKKLEDLRVGQRVSNDEYESKDDVRDFALWKAHDEQDGDVFWETSLGRGRPGWHIECSAMSMEYLGESFDIHTGGVDNIFPHHENEIAQSLCSTDGEFARYWMHCEFLIVEGKKMSKSLGNFYTIRDLEGLGYRTREIRYVLAGTHYRSQLNFTFDGLKAAHSSLARLDEFRESWSSYPEGGSSGEVAGLVERAGQQFDQAMDDDLNVSRAYAAMFNLVRQVNGLSAEGKTTSGDQPLLEECWQRWDDTLGVMYPFPADDSSKTLSAEVSAEWIEEKLALRQKARQARDWTAADAIRNELESEGVLIKDSSEGTTWKIKQG